MNWEWLQANWIVVAAAAGVTLLALVALIIAVSRPKKPSNASKKPTGMAMGAKSARARAPAAAAPKLPPVDLVYEVGGKIEWQAHDTKAMVAGPSGLLIPSGAIAISVLSAPARAGDDFICDYEVQLLVPASNGGPVNFYVGAVLRDAAGILVGYWVEQDAFAAGETIRKGTTYATAPKGSATVHIGVHGSWLADNKHGDGEVAFTKLHVYSK